MSADFLSVFVCLCVSYVALFLLCFPVVTVVRWFELLALLSAGTIILLLVCNLIIEFLESLFYFVYICGSGNLFCIFCFSCLFQVNVFPVSCSIWISLGGFCFTPHSSRHNRSLLLFLLFGWGLWWRCVEDST